jgi:mediator of RNA polymerase II transcription subunit 13
VASLQQSFALITVLFSVDLSPPLAIIPSLHPSTLSAFEYRSSAVQTPVGTPRPGVSPEPSASTPTGTPSESKDDPAFESDSQLIDITDETCAIIFSHRPIVEIGPDQYRQTLASGLLVKIPPQTPTQNPFDTDDCLDPSQVNCIALHLLWGRSQVKAPGSSWNHPAAVQKVLADSLLKEFMTLYRNLALLAKVRDLKDGMGGLIPWHILVASRGSKALDLVYGMKPL